MLPPCSHVFNHPAPAGVATGAFMTISDLRVRDFADNHAEDRIVSDRYRAGRPPAGVRYDHGPWFRLAAAILVALTAFGLALVPTPARAQTVLDGSGANLPEKVRHSMIEQITSELKDPASAQFRRIRSCLPKKGTSVAWAGEVNAKNSYGGYGGFKKFFFALGSDGNTTGAILDPDQLFNDSSEFLYKAYGCTE